jgi:hypothetical protein
MMLMQKDAAPASAQGKPGEDKPASDEKQPRFVGAEPPRLAPLGRLRTDDEARLAAEIEKLR